MDQSLILQQLFSKHKTRCFKSDPNLNWFWAHFVQVCFQLPPHTFTDEVPIDGRTWMVKANSGLSNICMFPSFQWTDSAEFKWTKCQNEPSQMSGQTYTTQLEDGKPAMKMSCQIRGCIMLHMYALHHTIPRSNWPFLMTEDCQSTSHLQVVTRPPYLFDVWCHKKGNLNVEARTNPMVTELLLICVKIPTGEATRLFGLGPIDQRW